MKQSIVTKLAAAAAAVLLIASGSALAQDHRAMARGHGGDFSHAIAALKGQLNLNTSQQQMWDSAVANAKAARATARSEGERLHAAMAAELQKPEPNLAAVATVSDDVQARNTALRRQVRDSWLAVYATFSPDQKTIVRDALAQRMSRMERFRQRHAAPNAAG